MATLMSEGFIGDASESTCECASQPGLSGFVDAGRRAATGSLGTAYAYAKWRYFRSMKIPLRFFAVSLVTHMPTYSGRP